MEDLRLESLWALDLQSKGWSHESAVRVQFCLAKGTIRSYNSVIARFAEYCSKKGCDFPPTGSATLADFLRFVSDKSSRPNSVLHTTIAALGHLYAIKGMRELVECSEIKMLVTGLVKSGTVAPMVRSKVMPIQSFHDLFNGWPCNEDLDLKRLRLKAITLLALTLMLRPSDIAPNAVVIGSEQVEQICFSTNQIEFLSDSAKITFFGIKNDTNRTGFEVMLPRADDQTVDPVSVLECYIAKTENERPPGGAVFLSLRAPFGPLQAASVAKILEESICLAGLDGQGFSAKSFRPTGATSAIEQHMDPDIVRKLGRWKNSEVFYAHYVHAQTPDDYTSNLLKYQRKN